MLFSLKSIPPPSPPYLHFRFVEKLASELRHGSALRHFRNLFSLGIIILCSAFLENINWNLYTLAEAKFSSFMFDYRKNIREHTVSTMPGHVTSPTRLVSGTLGIPEMKIIGIKICRNAKLEVVDKISEMVRRVCVGKSCWMASPRRGLGGGEVLLYISCMGPKPYPSGWHMAVLA